MRYSLRILIMLFASLVLVDPPDRICACVPPNTVAPRFVEFSNQYGHLHWEHSPVTYSLGNTPDFAKTSFASSFKQWSDASGGLLTFVQSDLAPDITVTWDTAGKLIDAIYLGYTYVTVAPGTASLSSATIIINAYTYDWHSGVPRGAFVHNPLDGKLDVDIDGVSLHEIGHALGLDHSDKDPSKIVDPSAGIPTMNSAIYPGAEKLHPDDIAGLLDLYSGVAWVVPDDFSRIETALTSASVQHSVVGPARIPRQLVGKSLKSIIIGHTYLYFDASTGEYLGQKTGWRFLAK